MGGKESHHLSGLPESVGDKWAVIGPPVYLASGPSSAVDYVLESSLSVTGPQWDAVTVPVVPNGDRSTVTIPTVEQTQFFRLRQPTPP